MTSKLYDYLEGDQSHEDKKAFEKQMNANSNLKETVDLYNDIDGFMNEMDEMEAIKNRVGQIHRSYKTNKRKIVYMRWGSVAASILIIVGVFTFVQLSSPSVDSIYNNQYTAWHPKNVTRGAMVKSKLSAWVDLYNSKDYQQVIEGFEELGEEYKQQPQVILMYISALMQQENYEKALSQLSDFDLQDYSFFETDFDWYKALCRMKLNQLEEAKKGFARLAETKKYGEQAKEILKDLN